MCGICGYVTPAAEADFGLMLRRLNHGLFHRGPDDEGFFEAPGVGLAMRRLSILDIGGSHQPIGNEDGTVQVIFNGEIYNYIELRAKLLSHGHHFVTQGDTEVLVHLYEEHGVEMLQHLRGMFAFALWDARKRLLFLARDRLGKKPLCYASLGNRLLFCSEILPLAASGKISGDIDPIALEGYLTFGFVPSPRTIYRDIRKLPPGHFLTWQGGETRIQCYWQLDFKNKITCNYEEAKERVRTKLDESIRLRLRSDVPLGLLLSGGLDSNAILARLTRGLGQRVQTFTIGFDEKRYDESDLARLSAKHFGAEHHELSAKADLLDLMPKLVRHYGEPFADKSALPSFLVCELTRGYVKVALNGDGGDEAFAGYRKYRTAVWQKAAGNLLSASLRHRWIARSRRGNGLLGAKPGRNLRRLLMPDTESLFTSEFFTGTHFKSLVTQELCTQTDGQLDDALSTFWKGSENMTDRMLAWDYNHYLADDLLVKMDIASMAFSLEVRSPFLDHELVELCARLPSKWKGDARQGKRLLREIVAADLPAELLAAPKRGFSVPLEEWWRGPAQKKIRESLENLHPDLHCFINPSYAIKLLNEHQQGRRNHAQRLWCLCVLNAWAWERPRVS